jgi:hypothetical protein
MGFFSMEKDIKELVQVSQDIGMYTQQQVEASKNDSKNYQAIVRKLKELNDRQSLLFDKIYG